MAPILRERCGPAFAQSDAPQAQADEPDEQQRSRSGRGVADIGEDRQFNRADVADAGSGADDGPHQVVRLGATSNCPAPTGWA